MTTSATEEAQMFQGAVTYNQWTKKARTQPWQEICDTENLIMQFFTIRMQESFSSFNRRRLKDNIHLTHITDVRSFQAPKTNVVV